MPLIIPIALITWIALFGAMVIFINKRPQKIRETAKRLGLIFRYRIDIQNKCYRFLKIKYANNAMFGSYKGYNVILFERTDDDCNLSFFIIEIDAPCPDLIIGKENVFTNIGKRFGFNDINFDSHEFSQIFNVKSKNKKFAYDFCNSQMIEYLLCNQDLNIKVNENLITMKFTHQLKVNDIKFNLDRLVKIHKLMPKYLFENTTKSEIA